MKYCSAKNTKSFSGDYKKVPGRNMKKPQMKEKKKQIFWLVSDCETDNKREEYAKKLNNYIPVDIYGQCPWKETSNITIERGTKKENKEAMANLQNQYKFYLAFENSNCYDYVTEKFFRTLGHGLIPIVMGGAKNYEKFAPHKSYINVNDYESPEKLAQHLKYLDEHDNAYLKYFNWMNNYDIYRIPHWCQVCRKLNDFKEPEKSYSNITEWWTHDPDNNNLACDV